MMRRHFSIYDEKDFCVNSWVEHYALDSPKYLPQYPAFDGWLYGCTTRALLSIQTTVKGEVLCQKFRTRSWNTEYIKRDFYSDVYTILIFLQQIGAAVAEWLSSWLAEQEDRGSIPRLAT